MIENGFTDLLQEKMIGQLSVLPVLILLDFISQLYTIVNETFYHQEVDMQP